MHSAIADLNLNGLDVIHRGGETFPLSERIRAVSLMRLETDVEAF